jgi:hypothetical protein
VVVYGQKGIGDFEEDGQNSFAKKSKVSSRVGINWKYIQNYLNN